MARERIPSDDPIQALWTRFSVLESISGARHFLERRAAELGVTVSGEIADRKAQAVAFSIRSAHEYFAVPVGNSLTVACLAYYYGALALLQAELVADPRNSLTLAELEGFTQRGHGLKALTDPDRPFGEGELIMVLSDGFLPRYLRAAEYPVEVGAISVTRGYQATDEVSETDRRRLISADDLWSRMPEVRALYVEIFQRHPRYLGIQVVGHESSMRLHFPDVFNSQYLTPEHIRTVLEWPSTIEIDRDDSGFRTATQHRLEDLLGQRPRHNSVLAHASYVEPLLGLHDVLVFNFMFLYQLSIWVRYRPALWRDINEGELSEFRPLVSSFLTTVQRTMPNEVLDRVYGREFLFAPFSYWS